MKAATIPTLVEVRGGALLRYATAPGFAMAICGYDAETVEEDAKKLGINIIEYYFVCGWSQVERMEVEAGVLPQWLYDLRWPDDNEF